MRIKCKDNSSKKEIIYDFHTCEHNEFYPLCLIFTFGDNVDKAYNFAIGNCDKCEEILNEIFETGKADLTQYDCYIGLLYHLKRC